MTDRVVNSTGGVGKNSIQFCIDVFPSGNPVHLPGKSGSLPYPPVMGDHSLNDTAHLLCRHWGLNSEEFSSWESLRRALSLRLEALLEDDFGALVNAMYRLDVAEAAFKQALNAGNAAEIATELTEIVLQREFQRLATRRKYQVHPNQSH